MSLQTKVSTITIKKILKKNKALLDRLPTREAQVLRMHYGISEPKEVRVGTFPNKSDVEMQMRLAEIEEQAIQRAHNKKQSATIKQKIIQTLKSK